MIMAAAQRYDFKTDYVGPPIIDRLKFNWAWLKWIIPLLVVLYLMSGIYIVQPGEQGVVRRFGKADRVVGPGPHYHIPPPFEMVNKVQVEERRRIEIGFATVPGTLPARYRFYPEESLMLTGDEQIIDAQIIIQYKVSDPKKFLFNVRDLEGRSGALKDAAEVALRHVVGQRPIDDVLVGAKFEVEADIKLLLQQILDGYDSGVRIEETKLQTVQPPSQVASAFSDVVSAREDKDRLIKEAEGYKADIIPKARGEAESILRASEGYKEERIKRAQGDADRFLAVLAEYRKAKDVTRKRLYIETMEKVLPNIRKFIIDAEAGGNLLQLLPLNEGAGR